MNNHATLTKGPIGKTLIRLAIPMVYGMIAIFMFNLVDTFYVGMLGAEELAAMGFTFPIIYAIMSIIMGIGIGSAAVISKSIGKNHDTKVKRLTTHSIILAFLMIIILAIIGIFTINPLFKLLGATGNILFLVKQYMFIWFLTVPFLVIPMTGNNAIRATGNTKTPSKIMITAGIINAVLDPFLIFGIGPFPRLELQGAAIATAISWFVIMLVEFWILGKKLNMLEIKIPKIDEFIDSSKKILHIGIPTAVTNMLIPLSLGIITHMVASYGVKAVAAFGVIARLESMAMIGIMALSAVMTPFIGQNFGARKCERIRKAISFSVKSSMVWGFGVFLIFLIFAKHIAMLFNNDPEVIANLVILLTITPVSYGLYGVAHIISSSLNAINKPLQSAIIIFIRLFILMVPLAYLGSKFYGFTGLVLGMTLANIIIGIIAHFRIKNIMDTIEKAHKEC